jgi:hypothetical protein
VVAAEPEKGVREVLWREMVNGYRVQAARRNNF